MTSLDQQVKKEPSGANGESGPTEPTEPTEPDSAATGDASSDNRNQNLQPVQIAAESDKSESCTPPPKGPTLCAVCESKPSKYKCPRCYLPYCSIACNKIHQSNHPAIQKPEPGTEPPSDRPAKPVGPSNPFQALDNSDKLAWLFRKYPNLPQQLLDIHAATQPPAEDPSKQIPASLMHGIPRRNHWNRDKGINRGKAALRRARQLPGEAGEAIREYCTLILLLLNDEESGKGARSMLQQQFAQQDADIIRQLIEEDKRRS